MASDTGGVKPFSIQGRTARERERLLGMTDSERAWRAQWIKDQHLAPEEPVIPKDYYKQRLNPIRRFYMAPLDKLGDLLAGPLGEKRAYTIRFFTGKGILALISLYSGFYYFKYNKNDWSRKGSWRVISARPATYPGDPGYPKITQRTEPNEYASRGFNQAPI